MWKRAANIPKLTFLFVELSKQNQWLLSILNPSLQTISSFSEIYHSCVIIWLQTSCKGNNRRKGLPCNHKEQILNNIHWNSWSFKKKKRWYVISLAIPNKKTHALNIAKGSNTALVQSIICELSQRSWLGTTQKCSLNVIVKVSEDSPRTN